MLNDDTLQTRDGLLIRVPVKMLSSQIQFHFDKSSDAYIRRKSSCLPRRAVPCVLSSILPIAGVGGMEMEDGERWSGVEMN